MKNQFAPAIVLVALSFFFVGKTSAKECFPNPCDTVCPNPCDNVCPTKPTGCYLYDKSIFTSPIFENQLVGKKSKSRIQFYGWMLTGITANSHGATQTYGVNPAGAAYEFNNRRADNGALTRHGMDDTSGNTYMLQTEQPTDWKVNQIWVGARRDLNDRFGWGFQADFAYGTDSRYARNWGDRSFDYHWGSGDYFATFAQLFATVGTKDLFVKVGKFGGNFSHEKMTAPTEFFYSHANICYGRPLVAEGAVLEWHPNEKWLISGGWIAGVYNSFENPYNDNAFLGKVKYNFTKDSSLTYNVFYSDRGARPTSSGQIESHHVVIYTHQINKQWFYMGELAFADQLYNRATSREIGYGWGISNHLICRFSERFAIGFRGEYNYSRRSTFDLPNLTFTEPGNGGQGADLWAFTVAANYKMTPKVTFRPEIRYDYTDYNNGFRPFGGDQSKKDQLCGGVSFIVMF